MFTGKYERIMWHEIEETERSLHENDESSCLIGVLKMFELSRFRRKAHHSANHVCYDRQETQFSLNPLPTQ